MEGSAKGFAARQKVDVYEKIGAHYRYHRPGRIVLAELLLEKGYLVHGLVRRSSSFSTGRIDHLLPGRPRATQSPASLWRLDRRPGTNQFGSGDRTGRNL